MRMPILLGAIGGPKWSAPDAKLRPETGPAAPAPRAGRVRQPAAGGRAPCARRRLDAQARSACEGVDLVFVRELTGGIYFGEKTRDATRASDLCTYTVAEDRTRHARGRRGWRSARRRKLTSIDKSNVLETSRLWREVVDARDEERIPRRGSSSTCWWTPRPCT